MKCYFLLKVPFPTIPSEKNGRADLSALRGDVCVRNLFPHFWWFRFFFVLLHAKFENLILLIKLF